MQEAILSQLTKKIQDKGCFVVHNPEYSNTGNLFMYTDENMMKFIFSLHYSFQSSYATISINTGDNFYIDFKQDRFLNAIFYYIDNI